MHPFGRVRAHRDGRQAVAPPDDAFLGLILDVSDLGYRHEAAAAGLYHQIAKAGHILALARVQPRDDGDGLVILAEAADGGAGDQHLQLLRQLLRGQAERARLVLVDADAQRLHLFAPVDVDLAGGRMRAHQRFHLGGDGAHLGVVLAHHPELHRIAYRRAVLQPDHPAAHIGEVVVEQLLQPFLHLFAHMLVAGHQHQLGVVQVLQLLVQRQVEARPPLPT